MGAAATKRFKIFSLMALFIFGGTLADLHLGEYSSNHKQDDQKQADTCCVACCPTHNLGPSVSLLDPTPVDKIDCELPIEITFYSEEFIASVFHPPRLVA